MTKKLSFILAFLILTFALYLFFFNFESIMDYIDNIIDKLITPDLVIPKNNEYERNYEYTTFSKTNNFKPVNKQDLRNIYYTVLNNGWKDFTFYCSNDYKECSSDVKAIADDTEFISLINNYVSPYNSFKNYNTLITGEKEVYISIDKLYKENEIKQIDAEIDRIIKNLNINKDNFTTEDIRSLHHYLIYNVSYDSDYKESDTTSSSNKAYGTLFTKKAICSGYADTFALMMDKLELPNFKVSSLEHVWNVVNINGKWYHVDVTWDDDEVNKVNYNNFFLINTKDLLEKDDKDHMFDQKLYTELN